MGKDTLATAEQCRAPAGPTRPDRNQADSRLESAAPKRRKRKPAGPHLDGRTRGAKRIKAVTDALLAELGGVVNDATMMVRIRRAAELVVAAEIARGNALTGKKVDLAKLIRLEGVASRAVKELQAHKAKPPSGRELLERHIAATRAAKGATP